MLLVIELIEELVLQGDGRGLFVRWAAGPTRAAVIGRFDESGGMG